MKGIQGLIIAVALALIAAFVNYKYLLDQAKEEGVVEFVVVRPEKKIKQGQQFKSDDLSLVKVPKDQAKSLSRIAFTKIDYVVPFKATRDYEGNELILSQDLKTVSHDQLPLGKNEVAIWVPVDSRRFVAVQVIPGKTQVMFRLPKSGPTPVGATTEAMELVGPFDVLSVGNRRGEEGTMRSESVRPAQENVLTIRGTLVSPKQLDALTTRVTNYLDKTNNRPLDVLLCPEQPQPKN